MNKCRYNSSEDCNNTDCLNCALDSIRTKIEKYAFKDFNNSKFISVNTVNYIINRYKEESDEKGITKEEAISILSDDEDKQFRSADAYLEYNALRKEALDMAIKALEQEPCEDTMKSTEKERLIKSDISSIENRVRHAFNQGYNLGYKEEIEKNEKQSKTGHWIRELIRNEKGGCIGAKMICSECGNDNKHDEYMIYCPNCGEKMNEPQKRSGET